jgi:murein L,D-transpeptidase YafK
VPESTARLAGSNLDDLRLESSVRIKALRERPPPGTIPSQFLLLSGRSRHAIAIDASRSRLYLFENTSTGLRLLGDYYISVGKSGVDKALEGYLRTPLGVYYITNTLNPTSLKEFYGSGALPINYPNPLDARRGKTGSGIWLHGTPPTQFARAPKASDGCVVLANPDLEFILSTVEIRNTPVIIATSLDWIAPQSVQTDASAFNAVLQSWRTAKSTGNLSRTLSHYANDFSNDSRDLNAYSSAIKKEIDKSGGREIALKDVSVLRWSEKGTDTMVVTFGEVLEGDIKGPKKRQYWTRQGNNQWKIFFEGTIG